MPIKEDVAQWYADINETDSAVFQKEHDEIDRMRDYLKGLEISLCDFFINEDTIAGCNMSADFIKLQSLVTKLLNYVDDDQERSQDIEDRVSEITDEGLQDAIEHQRMCDYEQWRRR